MTLEDCVYYVELIRASINAFMGVFIQFYELDLIFLDFETQANR